MLEPNVGQLFQWQWIAPFVIVGQIKVGQAGDQFMDAWRLSGTTPQPDIVEVCPYPPGSVQWGCLDQHAKQQNQYRPLFIHPFVRVATEGHGGSRLRLAHKKVPLFCLPLHQNVVSGL